MTKKVSKENKVISNAGFISYILGIVSIVQAFFSPFTGIILSIIGLFFSSKENSDFSIKGKKLNTIALIIGIIVLGITVYVTYVATQSGI